MQQRFSRACVVAGALSAFVAVALGAFAAHGLKQRLAPELLAVLDTGVRYQMTHALALLFVAWAVLNWPGRLTRAAGLLFAAGSVLFSGSLYVLVFSGVRAWGAVTPFGGLCFLAGWLALALAAWRGQRSDG